MSDLSYVRNNDGSYSKLVQLSGSIETETLLNAVAITTTSETQTTEINISSYDQVALEIENTLNQPVNIYFLKTGGGNSSQSFKKDDGTSFSVTIPASLGANRPVLITKETAKFLGGLYPTLRLSLFCTAAPTSGSITIKAQKRRR